MVKKNILLRDVLVEHKKQCNHAKIGLIGFGHIGGTLAHVLLLKKIGHVVAYDIHVNHARGKGRDLSQGLSIDECHDPFLHIVDDIHHLTSCDIIVVTAGMARRPNMEREELLHHNAKIIQNIGTSLAKANAKGVIIVVTNPVDIMARLMQETTKLPHHRVIGMAGVLDTGRFQLFLAEKLSVPPSDIHTCILGAHNPSMLPILSRTTVQGIPIHRWIRANKNPPEKFLEMLHTCAEDTRNEGATIVSLLESGSAYYGPAHGVVSMIEAILSDNGAILPVSACTEGKYGDSSSVYMGIQAILGKQGIVRMADMSLAPEETDALRKACQTLQKNYEIFHRDFFS